MSIKYEEDTAEYAVQQFIIKVTAGDLENVASHIGSKAKRTLKELREGTLAEADLTELKSSLTDLKVLAIRAAGGNKIIGLKNASKTIQFQVAKEGGKFVITEMNIR